MNIGLDPAEPYFQNTDPRVRLDKNDALFVDVIHTDASSIITGGFGMSQGCGHVDFYPNGGWRQPGCNETPLKTVFDSIGKERNVIHGIRRFIGCSHARAALLFTESINTDCPFMAYECSTYEEFASGLCTKGKNPCLSSHKLLDNNSYSNRSDRNDLQTLPSLQCLQMGFNAHKSWTSLHKYMNINTNPQTVRTDSKAAKSETSKENKYFLWTADRSPYCLFHYRIQVLLRYDISGSSSLPEKTRLFVQVFGTKGFTPALDVTKETQFSENIDFVISSANIGTVVRVELQLKSSPALVMNPLRWRLSDSNDSNQIYLIQITVTNLESGNK
ncbi:unnamed protein product [Oppiella nova]|uniref:Lipase domain-containing protein n=1 Tax=Oppiella nova TaxID=334625 RepID=A0A7R9QTW0_9ACAR|nr:unnamed protein product [Oppiella nova]CAG2174222.1 unnamed protein product [Oppiella nova]